LEGGVAGGSGDLGYGKAKASRLRNVMDHEDIVESNVMNQKDALLALKCSFVSFEEDLPPPTYYAIPLLPPPFLPSSPLPPWNSHREYIKLFSLITMAPL
jgi:hypothetical protein